MQSTVMQFIFHRYMFKQGCFSTGSNDTDDIHSVVHNLRILHTAFSDLEVRIFVVFLEYVCSAYFFVENEEYSAWSFGSPILTTIPFRKKTMPRLSEIYGLVLAEECFSSSCHRICTDFLVFLEDGKEDWGDEVVCGDTLHRSQVELLDVHKTNLRLRWGLALITFTKLYTGNI